MSVSAPPGGQAGSIPCHFASHVTHRSILVGPASEVRGHSCRIEAETERKHKLYWSEFCHLWGIDKLIVWSHYVLKQLIGRLLLCGIRHIMVNCLRNADCWKVSPLSGTWCEPLFCKHRCQMVTCSQGKPIFSSGKLYSQNALHVESAKQLFMTNFIPLVEHAPTLRHSMFLLYFSLFVYSPFFSYMAKLVFYIQQWMK